MKRAYFALPLALALGACGGNQGAPQVQVLSDSFCLASKKITWIPDDSQGTIEQIDAHNRAIDRACRKQRVASK